MSLSFSVITVCRNSRHTIARTIESVLSQGYNPLEYIIIDGASNDGTQDIVASYGNTINTFVSEPDGGIADAFNKGINMAVNDVVALINSDDMLLPGTLETVADYFRTHPQTDVVHGDVLLYEGERFVKRIKPSGRWWYPWRLVLFNHPATFVQREIYKQHGIYDSSYTIAMDVEIFLRWVRNGVNIDYLPEPLAVVQGGGVSGKRALEGYREVKTALLSNRFSTILTHIQFVARLGLQFILYVSERLRQLTRDT